MEAKAKFAMRKLVLLGTDKYNQIIFLYMKVQTLLYSPIIISLMSSQVKTWKRAERKQVSKVIVNAFDWYNW